MSTTEPDPRNPDVGRGEGDEYNSSDNMREIFVCTDMKYSDPSKQPGPTGKRCRFLGGPNVLAHEADCASPSPASPASKGRISTTLRTGPRPVPPEEISTFQRPNALILSASSARPRKRMCSGPKTMRLP